MTDPRPCPGYNCATTLHENEYLCTRCRRRAEKQLADIPALVDELDTTISRQARVATSGHRKKGDDQPLPYNAKAAQDADHALDFLYDWATYIAGPARVDVPRLERARAAAEAILGHAKWLSSNDQGPQCAQAISYVVRVIRRVTDRAPERLFAGPCHADQPATVHEVDGVITITTATTKCQLDLYREWGKDTIVCDGYNDPNQSDLAPRDVRGCGAEHPLADRRDWLTTAVETSNLPLRLVWESLYSLIPGCDLAWETVRKWPAGRKIDDPKNPGKHKIIPPRLRPAGTTSTGVKLYRGADILRLARDDQPRPGAKRRRTRTRRTA